MSGKLISGTDDFDPSLSLPGSTFARGKRWRSVRLRRFNSDGQPLMIQTRVALDNGVEVFEGDIVLASQSQDIVTFGLTVRQGHGAWPNGVIHAVVQPSIEGLVSAAIRHWMERTPLKFIRGTGTGGYLSFEDTGVCRSEIGCRGGPQLVEIDRNATVGAVVHEIGHAIGLWHEHSRHDRDEHVTIITRNVESGQLRNFAKHPGEADEHGPYDIDSMMHYESDAFSANGKPTIVTRSGGLLRPRQGLTHGDVAAVRSIYPQLAWS